MTSRVVCNGFGRPWAARHRAAPKRFKPFCVLDRTGSTGIFDIPGESAELEKAIEIKRRAQRCILNGDLDGALNEYEKLIASGDSDPYHSVLLADLLYKKGDQGGAARRYLEAVGGYERVGLVKNAIAVCKKMSRLSLSPAEVLERLASLHALDGLI